MVVLAGALQQVAGHARGVNTDAQLRRRLAQQQVEDRVPEDKQVCAWLCVLASAKEKAP
jgi:hypothetical protein